MILRPTSASANCQKKNICTLFLHEFNQKKNCSEFTVVRLLYQLYKCRFHHQRTPLSSAWSKTIIFTYIIVNTSVRHSLKFHSRECISVQVKGIQNEKSDQGFDLTPISQEYPLQLYFFCSVVYSRVAPAQYFYAVYTRFELFCYQGNLIDSVAPCSVTVFARCFRLVVRV